MEQNITEILAKLKNNISVGEQKVSTSILNDCILEAVNQAAEHVLQFRQNIAKMRKLTDESIKEAKDRLRELVT